MNIANSKIATVLITGATGFIGAYLVKRLQALNFQVRALTRSVCHTPGIEWITADITKPDALTAVCNGVDFVFHLAGYAHAWEEENAEFTQIHEAVNLQGTLNLAAVAQAAGVKRFVFFSTIKAVADSDEITDESWRAWPTSAYGIAKRQAEDQLLALCAAGSMEAVILRPSLVYGAGWKGNLAAMLKAMDHNRFPPPPSYPNKKSLVSVYDLADAAILAAQTPILKHHIFIVTDGIDYSTRQLYDAMRAALGKAPNKRYWPLWVWKSLGWLGDWMQTVTKKRPPISSQAVRKLFGNSVYRSLYLTEELGYVPRNTFMSLLPEIVKTYRASTV